MCQQLICWSSARIKSAGTLTGEDIAELERKFTLFVSDIADDSIPREKIFAHAGDQITILMHINDKVCPSWSFYGSDAINAKNATYCMNLIRPDALIGGSRNGQYPVIPSDWSDAIRRAFILIDVTFIIHKRNWQ